MNKTQKEMNSEVALLLSKKVSTIVIGFLPILNVFNFWNFRAELKQKRVISFAESLQDIFGN